MALGVVAYVVGVDETVRAVRDAGVLAFAVGTALTPVYLVFLAAAWAWLTRAVRRGVPFRAMLEGVVVGLAANLVTPSAYLGGEPLKVLYVGRATGGRYQEVAGTVLLSKYLEALSFIAIFSVGTVLVGVSYGDVLFAGRYRAFGIALVAVAVALAGVALLLWVSLRRRWRPLTRALAVAARLGLFRRWLARVRERTQAMEDEVSRVFRDERGASWGAVACFALAHLAMLVKPGIFFWLGAGADVGVTELCLIFVATQVLLFVQVTPAGVGMFEGGLIGFCGLIGVDPAQGAAYVLCVRITDALVIGVGAWLAGRVGLEILSGAGRRAVREGEAKTSVAPAALPGEVPS